MYFYNGTCIIGDSDEDFCDEGRVVVVLNEHQFISVMKDLSKLDQYYNLEIKKVLEESYNSNYAMCCGIEFKSIRKKVICPSCGKIVSLT